MYDFFKDEGGAAGVEYGLLIALIACVCIGAITAFGNMVNNNLFKVAASLFP